MIKFLCISDTHLKVKADWWKDLNSKIEDIDVMLFAGDSTMSGNPQEIALFNHHLSFLDKVRHKVLIAGNHDWGHLHFGKSWSKQTLTNAIYLEEESIELFGYKIYGTPWQKPFYNWAFNIDDIRRKEKYNGIPDDTEVLITHGPPFGILDKLEEGGRAGDELLLERVKQLRDLKLNVFGHLHFEGNKVTEMEDTIFVNAAICDDRYIPRSDYLIIELPEKD